LFLAISLLYSFVKSPETQSNVAILDPGNPGLFLRVIKDGLDKRGNRPGEKRKATPIIMAV
jgi:hypothetical protein